MPPPADQHVFGPVPSRRLGRSLGVDLVPHKYCTYDCIYCQLGATTHKSIKRCPFVSVDAVLREVEDKLTASPPPDYITLSGAGEPTLNTNLDALIAGLKRLADIPVAVITNGSLLWRTDVQSELLQADLVVPSIDAANNEMFQLVNRPHPDLSFHQLIDGLAEFRKRYAGQIWLEVFILAALNADDDHLGQIAKLLQLIAPDRVQLNTVARPPCESFAHAAAPADLKRAAQIIGPGAEVIADPPGEENSRTTALRAEEILALLQRRPCTLDDVAAGLSANKLEVAKHLEKLLRVRAVIIRRHNQNIYYAPAAPADSSR